MARILIADDDGDYRAAFMSAMEILGHQVTGVPSGDAVLPSLREAPADVLFLDLLMDSGGGTSTLHAVKDAFPPLPIVILTGHVHLMEAPLFREGLRLAEARFSKTEPLSSLDRVVRRLTE